MRAILLHNNKNHWINRLQDGRTLARDASQFKLANEVMQNNIEA